MKLVFAIIVLLAGAALAEAQHVIPRGRINVGVGIGRGVVGIVGFNGINRGFVGNNLFLRQRAFVPGYGLNYGLNRGLGLGYGVQQQLFYQQPIVGQQLLYQQPVANQAFLGSCPTAGMALIQQQSFGMSYGLGGGCGTAGLQQFNAYGGINRGFALRGGY